MDEKQKQYMSLLVSLQISILKLFKSMDIINRLPSQLAQYVFLYDDTYSNLYHGDIT